MPQKMPNANTQSRILNQRCILHFPARVGDYVGDLISKTGLKPKVNGRKKYPEQRYAPATRQNSFRRKSISGNVLALVADFQPMNHSTKSLLMLGEYSGDDISV